MKSEQTCRELTGLAKYFSFSAAPEIYGESACQIASAGRDSSLGIGHPMRSAVAVMGNLGI
jgi:hypothetical protein